MNSYALDETPLAPVCTIASAGSSKLLIINHLYIAVHSDTNH